MIIGAVREIQSLENRVALLPEHAAKLVQAGAVVRVETGIGRSLHLSDEAYSAAGAAIVEDRGRLLGEADLAFGIHGLPIEEVAGLKPGAVWISLMDPFHHCELVEELRQRSISAISLEMIPRITRAQKMDVLSSQANLGGYVAVILAAERLAKVFPMMMTAAGTISPSRVFVVGAGVAGLQAIATARRLGARVEAYDTRPVVEEQVKSLGARFVKFDLGETGQTKGGYATALTRAQLDTLQHGIAKVCAGSDVVITTAQIFGRRAPIIITADMVRGMPKGSVIVDLAVGTGGNVEGSKLDEEVVVDGVRIIGLSNLPGQVAVHASQMFSANLFHLISEFWDPSERRFLLHFEDEILQGCLITHQGEIVCERLIKHCAS